MCAAIENTVMIEKISQRAKQLKDREYKRINTNGGQVDSFFDRFFEDDSNHSLIGDREYNLLWEC